MTERAGHAFDVMASIAKEDLKMYDGIVAVVSKRSLHFYFIFLPGDLVPTQNFDWTQVLAKALGLKGGWIVRSHFGWGGERNILYKGVETSP